MSKIKITILGLILTTLSNTALAVDVEGDLLPRPWENAEYEGVSEELSAVGDLPNVTLEGFYTTIIKTILGWAMLLTIIAIVVAAIYYLRSRGKEEDITKAKDIILYLVIGMAIMAASYGIVSGILQFEFFE